MFHKNQKPECTDWREISQAKTEYRAAELKERAEQRELQAAELEDELVKVRERIDVPNSCARPIRLQMVVS